jgi:hypothetical protein
MLSLLAGSADQIRGQEWSAAAVKVTPVLRWNELVELLGPEILARRITELLDAVQNDDMEITQEEQSALVLGASYMTGNYPQRPFEGLVGPQAATGTTAPAETVTAGEDDSDGEQTGEPGNDNP